jgi:hypothetical protein
VKERALSGSQKIILNIMQNEGKKYTYMGSLRMRMSRIRLIMNLGIGLILILLCISPIKLNVESAKVTNLGNPPGNMAERTITLSGSTPPLIDATNYITMPINKGQITKASLNIMGLDDGSGNFPVNVTLDAGLDDDIEWAFIGEGFGSLGQQNMFSDGITRKNIGIGSIGYDYGNTILIPKNATVTSAVVGINYAHPKINNGDFETGDMTGWNIISNTDSAMVTASRGNYRPSVSWGDNYYLILENNPPGPYDYTCYVEVESDRFPRCDYLTLDWDIVEDDHYLCQIIVKDEKFNSLTLVQYGNDDGRNHYDSRSSDTHYVGGLSGNEYYIELILRHINTGDWGRVCIDDIYPSDVFGNPFVSYPSNLTLDIGNDGDDEWTWPNALKQKTYTSDIYQEINSLVQAATPTIRDAYGNEFVEIPVKISADPYGYVELTPKIEYTYNANVEIKPDYGNLVDELNDLIPKSGSSDDIFNIYLGVMSDSPGKIKISGINFEYNGAPEYVEIPTLKLDEDINGKVLNLTQQKNGEGIYFKDDYDSTAELSFGVFSNNNPEHLELSVSNDKWLKVRSLVPDWHGEAKVKLWCKDTEDIRIISDEIKILINPVNDPPKPNNPFSYVQMLENQTKIAFDLDDEQNEYFIDVDSEVLYYNAVLENEGDYSNHLEVKVLENNNLQLNSMGKLGKNIGVIVYCHDNPEIKNWVRSELELLDSYQIFYVNITSRARTFPPQWLPISISPIPEDMPQEAILKLRDYVTDEDDLIANLTYSIFSLTHSGYIDLEINEKSTALSIYPRDNFAGTAIATLAVTDDEQNMDLTTLEIKIIPSNDRPIVEISEPANNTAVRGMVEVIGSAYDPEGELTKVELSVGPVGSTSDWKLVDGLSYWTYSFDADKYPTTVKDLIVKVRAEDSTEKQSLMDIAYLKISRPMKDSDADSIGDLKDKFKNNPSEWSDTDGDGHGDNSDIFPDDVTQWKDTDGDGFGDNPDGNQDDRFPYDPTQWSDTDGDGHGDNEWGNNGDYFKFDPDRWAKEESEVKDKGAGGIVDLEDPSIIMWIVLVMMVILCVIVLINYGMKVKKAKKTNEKTNEK